MPCPYRGVNITVQEIYNIIESAASSAHAALMISLAMNVALAWGWWRRESGHAAGNDKSRSDWMEREKAFLECLKEKDDEVASIGHEALAALQDVAGALAGMERTLDGVETLVTVALNGRLHKEDKDGGK